MPGSPAPPMRVKAATLRAHIAVLADERRLSEVRERVSPATRALLDAPPLAGTWVDFWSVVEINSAVEALAGATGLQRFARKAVDRASGPYRVALQGLLRLVGTSPASIFKRLDDIVKGSVEGQRFTYTATSERSGILELRHLTEREVPHSCFVASMATLQAIFDACGAKGGIVGEPERIGPTAASFHVAW